MAKVLNHQSSSLHYERRHTGCMWGLLQFFEFYHRHHIRRRLAYRKHGDGERAGGATRAKPKQNLLPNGEEHGLLERDEISLMDDKSKSSGKARIKFLFSKLSRKKDKKRKISPLASQLMRTASIHHLECNDYVLPDEMNSERETLTTELSSHEAVSSAVNEHVRPLPESPDQSGFDVQCEACDTLNTIDFTSLDGFGEDKPAILIEKLNEAKETFLKQKGRHAKELVRNVSLPQTRELSNMLELFNANGELYLEFLQDPTYFLANYLHGLHAKEAILTKSGSFPGSGFTERKARGLADSGKKTKDHSRAVASIAGTPLNNLKPHLRVMGKSRSSSSLEVLTYSADETQFISSHFKDLKQRVKNIINGNRKEHHRISLDGILHKVPYGRKESEEAKKEKLWDVPALDRPELNSPRSSFSSDRSVFTNSKFPHRSIQRSWSLTESLDRYSRLFELHSSRESKRRHEKLKLIREDVLQDSKHPKSFGRIFSNPEYVSFLPAMDLVNDVAVRTFLSDEPQKSRAFVHKEDGMDLYSSVENTSDANDGDKIDQDLKQPLLSNEHDSSRIFKAPDDVIADKSITFLSDEPQTSGVLLNKEDELELYTSAENPSGIICSDTIGQDLEQPLSSNEHDPRRIYPDDFMAIESIHGLLHDQKIGNEVEQFDKPTEPSPVSILDSSEEDPLVPKESELEARHMGFEDQNSAANPQKQPDFDDCGGRETIEADSSKVQTPVELNNFNASCVHVDEKHETEFKYVRDVLKKSGLFGSPSLPVDPLLGEEEGPSTELDTDIDEADMSPDQQLLFDLINEVILEIYENSFLSYPGLSWSSNSRIRPFPAGHHVLEEVWSKISSHLSSQKQQDRTMEDIMVRDFARNDGWLNLHWDTELVGLELQALILDDMLDEVILQCADLTSPQCLVS